MGLLFFILGVGGAAFYCIAAFWQLEMIQVFGPDPYNVARILAPFGLAFLAGIFAAGWAIDFTNGRIREIFLISSALMTAGIGGMLAFTVTASSLTMALSFIAMFGIGAVFIPPVIVLTMLVPESAIGTIVGLAVSVRLIIGQVGYTIMFNLLIQQLTVQLPDYIVAAVVPAGLPKNEIVEFVTDIATSNLAGVAALNVTPAVLIAANEAVSEAYVACFPVVYQVGVGFAAAAVVASAFLPSIRKYMTDRVVVHIQ
jgi:hypothetical protein